MTFVRTIVSEAQLMRLISGVADPEKLVVVDFSSSTCGPCVAMKPFLADLSTRFKHVIFAEVLIDKIEGAAEKAQITSTPTFFFFKGGEKIAEVKGANRVAVENYVNMHQGPVDKDSTNTLNGHIDLQDLIVVAEAECLNQDDEHSIQHALTADMTKFLQSDTDEQLIINVPFNQTVKLHSIKIITHKPDQAPKLIKTWINRPILSFDEVEQFPPVQEIELTKDSYKERETVITLRYVKYQSVHSINLFIDSNIEDGDVTSIQQIQFFGTPVQTTDLNNLKPDEDN